MLNYIHKKYNFTNYQIEQLKYLYIMSLSEISKFIILLVVFRNDVYLYLSSIFILCCLRTSIGGLHCKTYLSCFMITFLFLYTGMILLPKIHLPLLYQCPLLIICAIINYIIGPITACGHPKLTISDIKKSKQKVFTYISFYTILLCITPVNRFLQSGFWIIILHTLQLSTAKKYQKEEL